LAGTVHSRTKEEFSFGEMEVEVDLAEEGEIQFSQRKISWSFLERNGASFQSKPNYEWFDAHKIGFRIRLRHWKQGDRFQPIGTKSQIKLQDLFTNLKIPRAERHKRIVALTERGEIFWVEGLRISEGFKLDKASTRRLKWHWRCLENPS
jgi:tRNA(Ile)-lysidine synthase